MPCASTRPAGACSVQRVATFLCAGTACSSQRRTQLTVRAHAARPDSRLLTAEADKTIKVWKEDTSATPESHPIDMEAWTAEVRRHKRY